MPGGCAIGSRPGNLHLFALKKLGAKIRIKNGYIFANANKGLKGNTIKFPKISVGATENAILAAVNAKGKTILINCAIEPEIQDLIIFLKKIGSDISIKKRKIIIIGNKKNNKVSHKVMFDRIELGTYIIAALISGNKVSFSKINPKIIKTEINILKKMGGKIKVSNDRLDVLKTQKFHKINLKTEPYPGFPTDLQAQIMVLMTRADGTSKIKENIFENRFMHVPELNRMGAKIKVSVNLSKIDGIKSLYGAEVMATDLRASVSLVLAGLIAKNRTIINRVYHLDRGYENLENKLRKCGANISRTNY